MTCFSQSPINFSLLRRHSWPNLPQVANLLAVAERPDIGGKEEDSDMRLFSEVESIAADIIDGIEDAERDVRQNHGWAPSRSMAALAVTSVAGRDHEQVAEEDDADDHFLLSFADVGEAFFLEMKALNGK